ncbi:MAG: hypothetical protein JO336_09535, partial [Acidobacteriia bacterium]|nr:hypothetical protein [Terriglobia bacterium]MBV8904035.1 hypothetical protein [Terriglobia bacterium]
MRRSFLFLVWVATGWSQPAIYEVTNAASGIPLRVSAGVPPIFGNGSIAQGAMFIVKGLNLGPESLVVANSYPLQTSLAGTSIQIVVGGQTTNAIIYYTSSQQVAAILPSATPVGFGSLRVSYNGHYSSFPINVLQNNVGMYTIGQTGAGDALVTRTDSSLILPNNAPNPGDIVTFWATGLGPVPYDETVPALGGDMTSVPLEVFIGGRSAQVLYRGRSTCCSSLDQVNAEIPPGVSTGCVVSVVMRINSLVSNTTTIPIAASGRLCTPTNPAISQSDVQRLIGQNPVNVGIISLE